MHPAPLSVVRPKIREKINTDSDTGNQNPMKAGCWIQQDYERSTSCCVIGGPGGSFSFQTWKCRKGKVHCIISHKNPVSALAMLTGKFFQIRKFFANPESFWNKLIIGWRISGYSGKSPDTLQKYPNNMQSVRMNWKVSGQSKKCLDNLENVSG